MRRNAFTMIELIFVIVVLGILAAVAIPKFSATRDDALIAKGRADIAAIRSGIISERQTRLVKGDSTFITKGNLSGTKLFDGVMMYGITASSGNNGWSHSGTGGTYTYKVNGTSTTFKYRDSTATNIKLRGTFTCSGGYCSKLTD